MTPFDVWLGALETRHLADLQFREVTRALRALSSTYVERRHGLSAGAALSGAGKRAAFALFYGPLHYLLVQGIVSALPGADRVHGTLADLGCGTGAAGAAWAAAGRKDKRLAVFGIDRHPWAAQEAGAAYRELGLSGRARVGDIAKDPLPQAQAFLAAFTVNELSDAARNALLPTLLEEGRRGRAVLIVEPLARSVTPWWPEWSAAFEAAGGRADEWRFQMPLPAIVAKLDRAAGLNHRELTGRSLWMGGGHGT
jgi:SAM-dependent methyltransferase